MNKNDFHTDPKNRPAVHDRCDSVVERIPETPKPLQEEHLALLPPEAALEDGPPEKTRWPALEKLWHARRYATKYFLQPRIKETMSMITSRARRKPIRSTACRLDRTQQFIEIRRMAACGISAHSGPFELDGPTNCQCVCYGLWPKACKSTQAARSMLFRSAARSCDAWNLVYKGLPWRTNFRETRLPPMACKAGTRRTKESQQREYRQACTCSSGTLTGTLSACCGTSRWHHQEACRSRR